MARPRDPSTPRENRAYVHTGQERPKNHEAVQAFRPATEERADPETSLTSGASNRDLKMAMNLRVSERILKRNRKGPEEAPVVIQPTPLSPKASNNCDSESSTTYNHHTKTERISSTKEMASDLSNESLDGSPAPLQRPSPAATFAVQNHIHPYFVISPESPSYEKLAKSNHRIPSTSVETKPRLDTLIIKKEQETSFGEMNIPRIMLQEAVDNVFNPGNDTESKDVKTFLDLENRLDNGKFSNTRRLRPGINEPVATMGQTESARLSAAAKNVFLLDCNILAQKLDIDITSTKHTCAAFKPKGGRCKSRISKVSWKSVCIILDHLISFEPYDDGRIWVEELKQLACLVLCKRDHQGKAVDLAKVWEKLLFGSVQSIDDSSLQAKNIGSPTSTPELKNGLGIIKTGNARSSTSPPALKYVSGVMTTKKFPINYSFYRDTNRGMATMIRRLVPFDAKVRDKIQTREILEGAIRRDLIPREDKDGFIYIYWFPANLGHIKIGVTTRSPEKRLQEWKNQCGHEPDLVYPILQEDMQRVPHAFRVETIVQAELRKFQRLEVKCDVCHKKHREWFEKSALDAIAAVRKWSAWVRNEPYTTSETQAWDSKRKCYATQPIGRLKDEHRKDLRNLSNVGPDVDGFSAYSLQRLRTRRSSAMRSDSRFRTHSEQPRRRSLRL